MNILLSFILFLTVVGNVQSRNVKFSIITFGKKATVTIPALNKTTDLQPNIFHNAIQTGLVIGCPDTEFEYSYHIDGKEEPGVSVRKLPAGQTTTYNELVGRPETISKLKGMGYPADQEWTRSYGKTELFDDSYIPTVIIDNTNVPKYFTSPYDFGKKDEKTKITLDGITFILKETIFTDKKVETAQKSRYNDKVQFKVKLNDGHKLYKRKSLKFRASGAEDPSFLGESLYADLAKTIGNPVHDKIFARVYLKDGTPIGLYLMIEVTSSKSFIKTQFYGDEITGKVTVPPTGLGFPLDAGMGSDFIPGGSFEKFKHDEGETNERVIRLADAMAAVDVNNEQSVQQFHKEWLDLDIFFKALAMEYLTGHWDSYWMFQTNYVMYDAPEESTDKTFRFYFLDQDFDLTFGVSLPSAINSFGDDFVNQSYKTLVDRTWTISEYDGPTRAAIDKFLKGGITTKMFENHLIDIVKHVFNPVALGRRIDEYIDRYSKEIEWDYQQPRLHIANDPVKTRYVWTVNDYYENLDSTPKVTVRWGLKQYVEARAKAVAQEFGFEWDATPIEPKPKPINTADNPSNVVSGAISLKASLIMTTLTTLLIGLLLI